MYNFAQTISKIGGNFLEKMTSKSIETTELTIAIILSIFTLMQLSQCVMSFLQSHFMNTSFIQVLNGKTYKFLILQEE